MKSHKYCRKRAETLEKDKQKTQDRKLEEGIKDEQKKKRGGKRQRMRGSREE